MSVASYWSWRVQKARQAVERKSDTKDSATDHDISSTILRCALGLVMFPHGAQKVLGWFGGSGLTATIASFQDGLGIPVFAAVLGIAAEFLGSLGLVVGLLGRVAAFGIASGMLVAASIESENGFFMNGSGEQSGEGIEYHRLALAIALAIVVKGSGAWSLVRWLSERKRS